MTTLSPTELAVSYDLPHGGEDDDAAVDLVLTHADRNAEFTAFMRSSHATLHRMAYLLCGDAHRADELTQHAFERTYRSWSRARKGDPLAYARKVLANLRVDTWRRTRRELLADPQDLSGMSDGGASGSTGPHGPAPAGTRQVEDRDAVVRALLMLPLKQRRVVVLRHLLDLPEQEVAAELRIPVGTVKSASARGLAHLRAILELDSRRDGRPPSGPAAPASAPRTPRTPGGF